jgi:hypothetical protein
MPSSNELFQNLWHIFQSIQMMLGVLDCVEKSMKILQRAQTVFDLVFLEAERSEHIINKKKLRKMKILHQFILIQHKYFSASLLCLQIKKNRHVAMDTTLLYS